MFNLFKRNYALEFGLDGEDYEKYLEMALKISYKAYRKVIKFQYHAIMMERHKIKFAKHKMKSEEALQEFLEESLDQTINTLGEDLVRDIEDHLNK